MIPEMKDKSRRKRERAAALAMVVCDRTAVKKSEVIVGTQNAQERWTFKDELKAYNITATFICLAVGENL